MNEFGPGPIDFPGQIRKLEKEISLIRAVLSGALVGSTVNITQVTGVPSTGAGLIHNFRNDTGGALADGTIIVLDSAGGRDLKTTTSADSLLALGAVRGSAGPYADQAETPVLLHGYHTAILVTGAVSIGDYLATSTTAGRAVSVGGTPAAGVFALAASGFAGPGNGTVEAYIFPVVRT